MILSLGQKIHKRNLEHLMVLEYKEVVRKPTMMGNVKEAQ